MVDIVIPSHMKFAGMMAGGKSYHNIDVDVLKSAIQKYVRRGMFDDAIRCVYELDLFQELVGTGTDNQDKGLKALRTNVFNRLLIMSIEDVGIGSPAMPILVSKLATNYAIGNKDLRRKSLYILTKNLCNARKSRETSHLRCVYSQVPISASFDSFKEAYPHIYDFDRNMDMNIGFTTYFDQGSDACFFYLFKAWYTTEKPTSVMHLLDYVIRREQDPLKREIMEILRSWLKGNSFKEIILFVMQIVLLSLRRDLTYEQDWDMEDNYMPSFEQHVLGASPHIHDYCIDKHTRMGKKMGKDLKDFANEGSHVENEDIHTNQEYKHIYIEFRQSYVEMEHGASQASQFAGQKQKPSSRGSRENREPSHQCEGTTKAGTQCKKTGTNPIDGHYFCNLHMPVDAQSSTPIAVSQPPTKLTNTFAITHSITMENLYILYQQPRGQLMTGRHKKQTIIPTEGRYKGYVIKGPWLSQDIQRLNTMMERLQMGKKYKIPLIPFIVATGADGNGYTIYNNVSPVDASSWVMDTKRDQYITIPWTEDEWKQHSDIDFHDVKIIDRTSMGITQLHKLSEIDQMNLMFGDSFLFRAFVFLAIMRVGDVGPWNVIVVNGKPYIIDYEENTSRAMFESVDNFFSKKAAKYNTLLTTGICNNKEKVNALIAEVDNSDDFHDNVEWSNIKKVLHSL